MIAKLIPADGGPPLVIKREVSLIGRKSGLCDIVLDHSSISKLHCVLARTDGLLFIRDLGSTNGTKVNGQRVTRAALLPGDEVSFASVRFQVFLGPGQTSSIHEEHTEVLSLPHEVVKLNFDDDIIEDEDSFAPPRKAPQEQEYPEDSREYAV